MMQEHQGGFRFVKTLAEVDGLTVAKLDEQLDILRQRDQMVPLKSKCGNKKEKGERLKEALKRYWKAMDA